MSVANGYAYVADDIARFKVIDISTPTAPVIVGSMDTPVLCVWSDCREWLRLRGG